MGGGAVTTRRQRRSAEALGVCVPDHYAPASDRPVPASDRDCVRVEWTGSEIVIASLSGARIVLSRAAALRLAARVVVLANPEREWLE